MPTILLVEDDPVIGQSLQIALGLEGMTLVQEFSLASARQILKTQEFALILLDINLPDGKGFELCQELRDKKITTPIIAITANLDDETAITTLGLGANDYVRKPFSSKELFYRIKMRIKESHEENILSAANLKIDLGKRLVFFGNDQIDLTRKEFDLLVTFIKRGDHVFSREDILRVIDNDQDIFDRTVDSHISHLRAKLKKHKCHHIEIKSVYGLGYKLVVTS